MLTKQDLIDAHDQGLNVQTKGGTNFKIVAYLMDVFAVQYSNSTKISWYGIDKINELQCSIESKIEIDFSILNKDNIYVFKTKLHTYISKYRSQKKEYIELNSNCLLKNNLIDPFIRGLETCVITEINTPTESDLELFYSKFPELKPKTKYNGRAVKCDTVEQLRYVATKYKSEYLNDLKCNFVDGYNYYEFDTDTYRTEKECIITEIEIISFSQYCTENGIVEPKWIQGFEVKDGYNDVVMVSDDNYGWYSRILKSIANNRFIDNNGNAWMFARYPKKEEINEIKFSN